MDSNAGDDLLQAQAHIWNHLFNFINSMALKCAVQLEIPDAIHRHASQPMPLSDLVSALKLDPRKTQYVSRLMRILVHSGFFLAQKMTKNGGSEEEEEEEGYSLNSSSRLLLKDNPYAVTPFLVSMLDPGLMDPWQFLSDWFKSDDRTSFDTAHGMAFWEFLGNKQRDGDFFNAGMASDARLVMSVLLGKYKASFEGLNSLVDVGGGTGTVAKAIAEVFPQTECTVFDLPQVVGDLKGNENLKYLAGDMFESIPPADALLLKWILHDWSDEECVKILKKCKEAITSKDERKGKVIIIDMVVDKKERDDVSYQTQLLYDMLMMIIVGGKERDEKEWVRLFTEAGFSGYKIFPIVGLRSLIEVYT